VGGILPCLPVGRANAQNDSQVDVGFFLACRQARLALHSFLIKKNETMPARFTNSARSY